MKNSTKIILGVTLLAIVGAGSVFLFGSNKKTPEEHLEQNFNTYIKKY